MIRKDVRRIRARSINLTSTGPLTSAVETQTPTAHRLFSVDLVFLFFLIVRANATTSQFLVVLTVPIRWVFVPKCNLSHRAYTIDCRGVRIFPC